MTTATFSTSAIPSNAASTATSSSGDLKSTMIGALDSVGTFASKVDRTLDSAANAINEAVPATTRFVLSLLPLPEAVNNVLVGATSVATRVATWVTRTVADAALQTVTLGAPAWSQAARQGVAVSGATDTLETNENSMQFLARCIAESAEAPAVRSSLSRYLDLRKELRAAQESKDATKLESLSGEIARLEVGLRDYQEFRDFKAALEQGPKFVQEQRKKIDTLAETTAERIISRVENYYRNATSGDAEVVKGAWDEKASPQEREAARNRLRDQISKRLHGVFTKELSSQETMDEIEKVGSDLHHAFGTYRMGFKAAMGSVLGATAITGALGHALSTAFAAGQQVATRAASSFGALGAGIGALVATKVKETVAAQVNAVVGPVAEAIKAKVEAVKEVPEKVANAAETAVVAAEVTKDKVADKINEVGTAAISPSDAIQEPSIMKIEPQGVMKGESCISGLPSPGTGARVEPSTEQLRAVFGAPEHSTTRYRADLEAFIRGQ